MFDPKFFDDISAKLSAMIAASPAKDIEKNVKTMMTSMFSRMDLVTREEFDVQRKVLERTREKLDAIEAQLARMSSAQSSAGNAAQSAASAQSAQSAQSRQGTQSMPGVAGTASDSDPGA